MNLFGEDMVIGDFRLSEHGLILASFDDESETEDDLGMNYDTVEEYISSNSVPVFIDAKYSEKLRPVATLIKDPCLLSSEDSKLRRIECR